MKFDQEELMSTKTIPERLLLTPPPGPWPPGPPMPPDLGAGPEAEVARAARIARLKEALRRSPGSRWLKPVYDHLWDRAAEADARDEWGGAPFTEGEFWSCFGAARRLKETWNQDSAMDIFSHAVDDWGAARRLSGAGDVSLSPVSGQLLRAGADTLHVQTMTFPRPRDRDWSAWRSHGVRADDGCARGWPKWFGLEVVACHSRRTFWILDESDGATAQVEAPSLAMAVMFWLHDGGWFRTELANQALAQEWKRHARGRRSSMARTKAREKAGIHVHDDVVDGHLATSAAGEAARDPDGSVPDMAPGDDLDGAQEEPERF